MDLFDARAQNQKEEAWRLAIDIMMTDSDPSSTSAVKIGASYLAKYWSHERSILLWRSTSSGLHHSHAQNHETIIPLGTNLEWT